MLLNSCIYLTKFINSDVKSIDNDLHALAAIDTRSHPTLHTFSIAHVRGGNGASLRDYLVVRHVFQLYSDIISWPLTNFL